METLKLMIELPKEVYEAMKNNVSLNSDQKGIAESIIVHSILSGTILNECEVEDCISRKYLKEDMIRYGWHHPDSTVTEYVEDLPSVYLKSDKPSGEWIPVSEALPSDYGLDWVLAQIQETKGGYLWIPQVMEYRKSKNDWFSSDEHLGWLKNHNGVFEVTAWMPLPRQYKSKNPSRSVETIDKEILTKRALLEFLSDYPDVKIDDIEEYHIVHSFIRSTPNGDEPMLFISHYVLGVKLKGKPPIMYIPKERVKAEKEQNNE